jgi:hypothetical protein
MLELSFFNFIIWIFFYWKMVGFCIGASKGSLGRCSNGRYAHWLLILFLVIGKYYPMRKVKTIFVCFFQVNLANLLKYQSHLADLLVSGWVQRAQLCKMTHRRTIWTKLDFYSTSTMFTCEVGHVQQACLQQEEVRFPIENWVSLVYYCQHNQD